MQFFTILISYRQESRKILDLRRATRAIDESKNAFSPEAMQKERIDYTQNDAGHLGRYANIMLDTAFKISFGKEVGHQNMLDLLHCLLPELDIQEITYDDKEQPGLFLSEKRSIFDLSCTTGAAGGDGPGAESARG